MSNFHKKQDADRLRERERRRRTAICRTFERTDRLFLGSKDIHVEPVDEKAFPPSWNTGQKIFLNFAHLDGRDRRSMAALWGLNYHGLAMAMLSPRRNLGKLLDWTQTGLEARVGHRYRDTLNLAEHWRTETQLGHLYIPIRRYFRIAFEVLMLEQPDKVPEHAMWLYVAGRPFIELGLRERFRQAFAARYEDSSRLDEMDAIIDGQMTVSPEWIKYAENHKEALLDGPYADYANMKGDERADNIWFLADEYLQVTWATKDLDHNEANLRILEKLDVLIPWEDLRDHTSGLPVKDSTGGTGPDLPADGQRTTEYDEQVGETMALVISKDKDQRQRLKSLLETIQELHHDANAELGQPEEEDEEDGDGETPGGLANEGPPPPPVERDPIVIIDPSENDPEGEEEDEKDEDGNPYEEPQPIDGTVTGHAGTKGHYKGDPRGNYLPQLSDAQREMLDLLFGDRPEIDVLLKQQLMENITHRAVDRDLMNMMRAIRRELGDGLALDQEAEGVLTVAPDHIIMERNRMERRWRLIRGNLEATYVDRQPRGKFHMRSFINSPISTRFSSSFRDYQPDDTAEVGLEAVVLLDRSGSMSGVMDYASQICWAHGSALQRAGSYLSLIGFADEDKTEVLMGRNQTLHHAMYESYGTYSSTIICPALVEARNILWASPLANKLLIVVTDAGWGDAAQALEEMKRIHVDEAVDSLLILLGMHLERGTRGCKHVAKANSVQEMGAKMEDVIKRIQVQAVRRIQMARGLMVN